MIFRRLSVIAVVLCLSLSPLSVRADSELNISTNGTFTGKQLKVMQIAGKNLFMRGYWGNAFLRVTVLINASTTITRSHGDSGALADLHEGDMLDVTGTLAPGAETVTVNAASIRNSSADQAPKSVAGVAQSVDKSALTLVLKDATLGTITVVVPASVPIKKGMREIEFGDVSQGDKILSASGTFDYASKTLTSNAIEIYQDKTIFAPRNFDGVLKSLSGTTLPTTAVVTVGKTDYTVYLSAKSQTLKKSKAPGDLVRFVVGDTVRLWGAIRQTDLTQIDAEIIRDLNF